MFKAVFHTHVISVTVFLLIYLIKTILLLANKEDGLAKFIKMTKVLEMVISTLFLVTGIYLITQIPEIKTLLVIKIVVVLASIPIAIVGFKKKNKALALLSFVMIVAAYGLAEMSKKQTASTVEAPGAAMSGQDIYIANCTKCHGDDGKAGIAGASDLSVSTLDVNAKMEIIKNGKTMMTPFNGVLTDEQIKEVAEFTETLKK